MPKKLFTEKQEQYLLSIQYGRSAKEVASMVNKKFGLNITDDQIKYWRYRTQVDSGRRILGRFHKGQTPHNKGKKYPEAKRNSGMFKKGNVPHHTYPVGHEKISFHGNPVVKQPDGSWRSKAKIMYEQYHGVTVPDEDYVIGLDGNRLNLEKDNLIHVTKAELLGINQYDVLRLGDKELSSAVHKIVKLRGFSFKKQKEGK